MNPITKSNTKAIYFSRKLTFVFALLVFVSIFNTEAFAQKYIDSTYYVSCRNRLSVGIHFTARSYKLNISQKIETDSTGKSPVKYQADAVNSFGFIVDYKKLLLQVGFRTGKVDEFKKGRSQYSNLMLNIGGNKFLFETTYRRYKGFYDQNTPNYLSSYNDTLPYFINNNLEAVRFKMKGIYFSNYRKFAYRSVYSCGYRQLKSNATWIYTPSIYREKISSSKGIIPDSIRTYYGGQRDLEEIRITGASFGVGGSGTLVLSKKFFINLTFVPSIELQRRRYSYLDKGDNKATYVSLNADVRSSIGYNTEKFFIYILNTADLHVFQGFGITIQPSFTTNSLVVGYRFSVDKNKEKNTGKKS
jgi:hypothetical protein